MDILKKIQNLPKSQRKLILWITVIVLGSILVIFWLKSVQEKIESFQAEEFKEELGLPQLEEKIKKGSKIEMPEINLPEISEEELKQLEEELQNVQQ